MNGDVIPRAAFAAWGRIGGSSRSKKKVAAARRTVKKATAAVRGKPWSKERQMAFRLRLAK
jgi:hypothetical protein